MSSSPTVWCSLPWFSFEDLGSAGYRPCAYHQPISPGADQSLEGRWRSRESGDLRYAFLVGRTPAGCLPCKSSEEASGVSPRLREMKRLGLSQQINLQTIAGLKAPHSLSVRLEEGAEEKVIPDHWLHELTHLTFFGAEPFSHKLFTDTVYRMVETGDAAHVSLALTTELCADPGGILQTLAQFGNLTVQVNLLDLGPRLDFLLPGTSSEFYSRLQGLRDFTTPGSISLVIQVNILNVFYISELLDKFRSEFPEFLIHLDTDSAEPDFHIRNLPPKAKSDVGHSLKYIDAKNFNFSTDRGPRTLIESLSLSGDPASVPKAFQRILKDSGRKPEEFKETFSLLWPFIEVPA